MPVAQDNTASQLQGWLNLLQGNSSGGLLGGSTTTTDSGGTTSTVGNLTTDQMTAIVSNILGGTGGLADVSMGQKGAGIYNSTVNSQLTNDLLTRITTQVAASNAGKTTTTSPTQKTATPPNLIDQTIAKLPSLALTYGAAKIGSPILGAASKKLGLDSAGKSAADWINGLGSSPSSGSLSGETMAANDTAGLGDAWGSSSGVDTVGSTLAGGGVDAGYNGASMSVADTAGADAAWNTTDVAASTDVGASAAAGAAGYDGAAAAAADTAGASDAWAGAESAAAVSAVICTEAVRQGLLPKQKYLDEVEGAKKRLTKYHIDGYHIWAIHLVRLMRVNRSMAKSLADLAEQYIDHTTYGKKSFVGYIGVLIGEPMSYAIGFLANKLNMTPDYKVALYGN
jgi:hypothetical protein